MNKKKEEKITEVEKPANPTPPGSYSGQANEVDGVLDIREEKVNIRLEKTTAGLGLSIAGGLGSTPFKGDDVGIFVSKVTERGPAELADLRLGDKLISVNGHSMVGIGHYDAVEILRSAGPVLDIAILREVTRLLPLHKNSLQHESVGGGDSACSSLSTSRAPSAESHNSVITSGFESTPGLNGPSHHSLDNKLRKSDFDIRIQTVYTTLIRDQNGLGFSIAGGKGCPPFRENSDSIYLSRITEGGAAEKDGKLQVGDRIVSINGVDLDGARHDQAVSMLTGLERFVRLVAEREVLVPKGSTPSPSPSPALDKQTRVHSSPKPYTGAYTTANSYIASSKPVIRSNTPTGTANPVTSSPPRPAPRKITSPSSTDNEGGPIPSGPTENVNTSSTNPSQQPRTKAITNEEFQAMIPAHFLKSGTTSSGTTPTAATTGSTTTTTTTEPTTVTLTIKAPNPNLANGIEFPDPPTTLGKVTETITKSTFTETVVTRVTDNKLADSVIIEEVTLVKDGGSLGFSIIGGTDHSCTPFGGNRPGIFISHIVPGGIAASSGKLRMGDRIIKAYGDDLTKCKHQEAVMTLLKPSNEITLTVQHDPLPEGFQDLTIVRQEGEKLGMHIKGGLRGHRGNPIDKSDEGVFISKINSGGAAKRDGRLKVGMRLLEVNGVSLLGASHQEAVNTLRTAGLNIHLVVCKGYDKGEVDKLVSEGKLSKENKSASHSVSSLDKEDEDSDTIRQEHEMKQELVAWEKEVQDRKERDQTLELEEVKDKSTPEKVMDVVHAAEVLALGGITGNTVGSASDSTAAKPKSPGGPKSSDGLKTTTIVMSKHTLAPQHENNQLDSVTMRQHLILSAAEKENVQSSPKCKDNVVSNFTTESPLETSLDDPKLRNIVPKPYKKSKSTNVRPISLILNEEERGGYINSPQTSRDIKSLSKDISLVNKQSDSESTQSSQTTPEPSPSPVRSILKSPPLSKKITTKHTPERGEYKVKIYDLMDRSKPTNKHEAKTVHTDHSAPQEADTDTKYNVVIHPAEKAKAITENMLSDRIDNIDVPKSAPCTSNTKKFEKFQNERQLNFKSATLPRAKTVRFDANVTHHQVPTSTTESLSEENDVPTEVLKTSVTQIPSPSRVEVTTIQTQPTTTNPTISCNVNIPLHVVNNDAQNPNPFINQPGYVPIPAGNQSLYYAYPYFYSPIMPPLVNRQPIVTPIQFSQSCAPLPAPSYYPQPFCRERPNPYFTFATNAEETPIPANWQPLERNAPELFSPSPRSETITNSLPSNTTPCSESSELDRSDPTICLSNTIQNISTNNEVRSSNAVPKAIYTTATISEKFFHEKVVGTERSDFIENKSLPFSNNNPFSYQPNTSIADDMNCNEVNGNKIDLRTDTKEVVKEIKAEDTSTCSPTRKTTNYEKFSSPSLVKQYLDYYENKTPKRDEPKNVFRFSHYRSALNKNNNEEVKEKREGSTNIMSLLGPSGYKPSTTCQTIVDTNKKTICGSLSNISSCAVPKEQEQGVSDNNANLKKEKPKIRPKSCYSQILSDEAQSNRSSPSPPPINYTTYPTGSAMPSWQEIFDKTPPLPGAQNN